MLGLQGHPGQLGQAEDAVAGEVADAGQAGERQQVVLTVVAGRVPLDVLAERRGTTRGALYKTIHDARRKLRAHLAEAGLLAGRR
jgi:RNA polymerase sigma-70 factor (ECF subfamily)